MNKIYSVAAGLMLSAMFVMPSSASAASNIVEIAQGNSNFTSLVSAVVSQDLAGTLSGPGPFTVFAPTNDAFASLPKYITDALAANPALLKDILLYHVVADDLDATEVLAATSITTAGGKEIRPKIKNGQPYINKAKITSTDIVASNGRIHIIDKVLIPKHVRDIAREMQQQKHGWQNESDEENWDCQKDSNKKHWGSRDRGEWRNR